MKKTKLIVLGLIKSDQNEILLTLRLDPQIPEAHLKWDLPGGTNEFGESLEETLVREVKEETGLGIQIERMLPWSTSKVWDHEKYKIHVVVFCFLCRSISHIINTKDPKIGSIEWVNVSDLKEKDYLPTTKFFIDKVDLLTGLS